MSRLIHVLLTLICFELGVLLLVAPWLGLWQRNYFLDRYPVLIPYLLNPYMRGAISGLGLVDIGIAAGMLRRRAPATLATRS